MKKFLGRYTRLLINKFPLCLLHLFGEKNDCHSVLIPACFYKSLVALKSKEELLLVIVVKHVFLGEEIFWRLSEIPIFWIALPEVIHLNLSAAELALRAITTSLLWYCIEDFNPVVAAKGVSSQLVPHMKYKVSSDEMDFKYDFRKKIFVLLKVVEVSLGWHSWEIIST